MKKEIKTITNNKKARFEYEFIDLYMAGIVLFGNEIKSIRQGHVNINDCFCVIQNGEMFIKNMYIKKYDNGCYFSQVSETRDRKLLLTKNEIRKLEQKIKTKGYTIVPTKVFINENGYCKIDIALAKGKKSFDKKNAIKERYIKRDVERELN